MKKYSKSLSGAATGVLVLLLVNEKPSYGYELAKQLSEITNGRLERQNSSLYPLLKKFEENGFVKSDWDMKKERPQKFYKILKNGRLEIDRQMEEINSLIEIVNKQYNQKT